MKNVKNKSELSRYENTNPDISNLQNCILDVRKAALDNDAGPDDPTDFSQLRGRLEACREKLPPLYRKTMFTPYVSTLDELGQAGFTKILLRDPKKEGIAGIMFDIAQSILQHGEGYSKVATDSFQEVLSDLYDGFLSAEDRKGIKPPDLGVIPPLAKWGNPEDGPYTWPVDATASFHAGAGTVNMPPANTRCGLLAWTALGHENTGHDILRADTGLEQELASAVETALQDENLGDGLSGYWSSRIDETASDVCGILNIGPAAGIGLIGYFRGLNDASYLHEPKLRNIGPDNDPHPADIVRGYLAASTVSLLSFSGANDWAKIIEAETDKDVSTIQLEGTEISVEDARNSAKIVASTIVWTKMKSLGNHALGEIQDWSNQDEAIVNQLRSILTTAGQLPDSFASGIYAAHAVAATVMEALSKDADIALLFGRMLGILKVMHDANQAWGPLFVAHPGNIKKDFIYCRSD